MKITIVVDKPALFDRMFVAEHGFSAFIEVEGKKSYSIRATRML